jgi:hypothetical protein
MNSKSPDTLEADQQETSNIVMLGYDSGDRSMVHTKYESMVLDIHTIKDRTVSPTV